MIEIAGVAILCNMLTHWFSPIQKYKYNVVDKLPEWMATPLLCSKCAGFWFGLLYFQNPILAAVTSFVSYLIDFIIYKVELWRNQS